jgi:elongator complex protein 3
MPGLPYSNPEKDLELFKVIFNDSRFRPDQLKIYPCQVVDDSPLAKIHKLINYKPYTEEQTREILIKMMNLIPNYCRVMRMMREFPKEKVVEGLERLDLRKDIEANFREKHVKIKEIRMREIGFNKEVDLNAKLKITEYESSNGKEFFLEFVNDDDILFGLLRLRIFDDLRSPMARDINGSKSAFGQDFSVKKDVNMGKFISRLKYKNALEISSPFFVAGGKENNRAKRAIVRELHVYGQALNLGQHGKGVSQHMGIGKLLMQKAEEITKENNVNKLSVISGVGVREYYKNIGYELEGDYMVKRME